jgi:hypothetical protein
MQPMWRKSTFSGSETSCVEITHTSGIIKIRDSKNPASGQLGVPAAAFRRLTRVLGRRLPRF